MALYDVPVIRQYSAKVRVEAESMEEAKRNAILAVRGGNADPNWTPLEVKLRDRQPTRIE